MWVAHWANVVANLVEVHGVESCGGSVVAQQSTEVAYSGPAGSNPFVILRYYRDSV